MGLTWRAGLWRERVAVGVDAIVACGCLQQHLIEAGRACATARPRPRPRVPTMLSPTTVRVAGALALRIGVADDRLAVVIASGPPVTRVRLRHDIWGAAGQLALHQR